MGADSPEIDVGTLDGGLYLGMRGRATQRTCPTADRIVEDYLAAHSEASGSVLITVDIRGCEWVDSTFAGWLLGVQKRLLRGNGARLRLANCTDRCKASLAKMQMSELFTFVEATPPAELGCVPCPTSDRPTRETLQLMIQAHEALATLGPDNARVFGPIVEVLQKQLQRM